MSQITGIVTDIQHYCVQDGPGIRTTVFLKGCPLHCQWCHNPETLDPRKAAWYNEKICAHCGRCAMACPEKAIKPPTEDEGIEIDHSLCQAAKGCHACADVCPTHALEIVGTEKTVEECVAEVLEDRAFYKNGGGACISGGEATLQPEFTEAYLTQCQDRYVNTSIETCCYTSWDVLERIMPHVDLFLIDIKHMDPEKHKEGTGVTNERILENIAKLAAAGKKIRIRVPIIPGFNDWDENLAATADFMAAHGIANVDLLAFHNTADFKYKKLGQDYAYANVKAPTAAEMQQHLEVFKSHGINGTIGGNDIPPDQI